MLLRLALATGMMLTAGAFWAARDGADAAVRTGTLSVSLTISSRCTVKTSSSFDPSAFEQAFLAGMPTNGLSVRCTAAVPFMLRLETSNRRINPAILRGPAYQTETTSPRLRELLSPDSPTTLIDTPSRVIIQPVSAHPMAPEPSAEALETADTAPGTGPRMLVVTY